MENKSNSYNCSSTQNLIVVMVCGDGASGFNNLIGWANSERDKTALSEPIRRHLLALLQRVSVHMSEGSAAETIFLEGLPSHAGLVCFELLPCWLC